MKKLNPKNWVTPIDIPEGKSGKLSIVHENRDAGWKAPLASLRTAMFQGDGRGDLVFPFPTRWHKLIEDDRGVWTSDLPIERVQQERDVRGFRGDVLLSGLGVGMIASILNARATVRSIIVVEKSEDVVRLVEPHLKASKVRVITADAFDYLEHTNDKFDYAFHDIWQSDGLYTFRNTVLPLKQLTRRVLKKPQEDYRRTRAWNEGCMLGQLQYQVFGRIRALTDESLAKFYPLPPDEVLDDPEVCLSAPFYRWMKSTKPDAELATWILERSFLPGFGTITWERRWSKWGGNLDWVEMRNQHKIRFAAWEAKRNAEKNEVEDADDGGIDA